MSSNPSLHRVYADSLKDSGIKSINKRNLERYIARLGRLRDYLKTIPDAHYNHASIVREANKSEPCQSVACAFGHSVLSDKFPGINATYTYKPADSWSGFPAQTFEFFVKDVMKNGEYWDKFDMEKPAEDYFGPGTWDVIFGPDYYWTRATKRLVISRIQWMINKYQAGG